MPGHQQRLYTSRRCQSRECLVTAPPKQSERATRRRSRTDHRPPSVATAVVQSDPFVVCVRAYYSR